MPSASALRVQIEASLARRVPSALTPAAKTIRPHVATGIPALDELLCGGLPVGAVTELVGPECSGRTSVALSFFARLTQAGKVCAWIDAADTFDPLSAASAGVDLHRLLWVRCCAASASAPALNNKFTVPQRYLTPPATKKGLHGGGFGPHPRSEVHGLSTAVGTLFQPEPAEPQYSPRCAEPQSRTRVTQQTFAPAAMPASAGTPARRPGKPWQRIGQALRSADLLLHGGGFSAIVLDMGGLAPEAVSRIPLATWYRYRAAAARTQASILLLTQYACAKSSAELVLEFQPGEPLSDEQTVFTGIRPSVRRARQRFTEAPTNVVPLRKPPQSVHAVASWASRTPWAGRR